MKVLHIYDHSAISCGIMKVIIEWNRELSDDKVQFDYLLSYHRNPSYDNEIHALGGKIYYMSDSDRIASLKEFVMNVKNFMKRYAYVYDVVHLHTTTFGFPYLYYASKYGIPVRIAHAHSVQLGNNKFSSVRNQFLLWPLKKNANQYLACSKDAGKAWFARLGISDFSVILNGIDVKKYVFSAVTRKEIRKELGISDKTMAVVHISNMSPIKNVPFVINVFEKILQINRDCELFLIGQAELPNEVRNLIEKKKLYSKVHNCGIRKDIPMILQAMDVCVMPSINEGLGIVAVEAQAASLPVIISKGFPDDVMITDKVKKMDYNIDNWAKEAIELAKYRSDEIVNSDSLYEFDSRLITDKLYYLYKDCVEKMGKKFV